MNLPVFVSKINQNKYRLQLWVQPGAKKNELSGIYQDSLKIRLKAPAVDNKANKGLLKFLGEILGIKSSHIYLHGGHASRKKVVIVTMDKKIDWDKLN